MPKKIAVVTIHGMGNQQKSKPKNTTDLSYSKTLHKHVRRRMGRNFFDENVAWHEIFWADVTRARQQEFLREVKGKISKGALRNFVLNNLTDAAAYQKTKDELDTVYEDIHRCVTESIEQVRAAHGEDIPIVLLAHSLGGHIMSNYIYDFQNTKNEMSNMSGFAKLNTLRRFFTFGCNIPIFTFAYQADDVIVVQFPGGRVTDMKGWWQNYYDRNDTLGYPLIPIGGGYKELGDSKQLKDHAIDAGGLFTSWNPLSHNAYWKDPDFFEDVADYLSRQI